MLSYALYFLIGIGVTLAAQYFTSAELVSSALTEALLIIGPITLTALVGSFLPAFASFARTEKWQAHAVKYGMMPVFGIYAVEVWRIAGILGFLIFCAASVVHFGYWTAGIHSRAYRLRMFELGFARQMPDTAQFIAVLNVAGESQTSDALIQVIMRDAHRLGADKMCQEIVRLFPKKDQKEVAILVGNVSKLN